MRTKSRKARPKATLKSTLKSNWKTAIVEETAMRDAELAKMSIKQLKDLRLEVDRSIAARQVEERNLLRDKFRAMADEAGFTLQEIVSGARGSKGRKVPAKFANPANPEETWSGRGRQPKWLAAQLKAGARIDDFRL